MAKKQVSAAIQAIEDLKVALVYPLKNNPKLSNLWHYFYPRSRMKWEWDEDGDDRVAELWHLRAVLSKTRKVAYLKWYQGRATFLDLNSFQNLLSYFESVKKQKHLSPQAKKILDLLEESSPRSTKVIKRECELKGKLLEGIYQRSMKELWQRGYIVGWGEVDDGAFPSLAIGATSLLFEDIWRKSADCAPEMAQKNLEKLWGAKSPFFLFAQKIKSH